jgi:hypothetical protein
MAANPMLAEVLEVIRCAEKLLVWAGKAIGIKTM